MTVPFVDLRRQYQSIQAEIDAARRAVVEDTAFIAGPYATEFETMFAEFVGTDHAVGCASGTDALELALTAMGVGAGDEVIVPALTWISTAEAVSNVGGTPVFADIDPDTYTLDPEDVEARITDRTRVLLPVHLYGQMADMPTLMALSETHDLMVLEDCAQAHGATLNGRAAGTWGDAAIFSFYPAKNLGAWGDAGAVVTGQEHIARRVRRRTNHGQDRKHHHQVTGRNSRLDGLQAAILSAKLPHLSRWNEKRRRHAERYDSRLADVEGVRTPPTRKQSDHVYHLYVVETDDRNELQEHLEAQGVSTSIHYPTALPFQPCYDEHDYDPDDVPIAYRATDRILSLPMFPEMTADERQFVVDQICAFDRRG